MIARMTIIVLKKRFVEAVLENLSKWISGQGSRGLHMNVAWY